MSVRRLKAACIVAFLGDPEEHPTRALAAKLQI